MRETWREARLPPRIVSLSGEVDAGQAAEAATQRSVRSRRFEPRVPDTPPLSAPFARAMASACVCSSAARRGWLRRRLSSSQSASRFGSSAPRAARAAWWRRASSQRTQRTYRFSASQRSFGETSAPFSCRLSHKVHTKCRLEKSKRGGNDAERGFPKKVCGKEEKKRPTLALRSVARRAMVKARTSLAPTPVERGLSLPRRSRVRRWCFCLESLHKRSSL